MSKQLVVYGAGGHGKVVAEILAASGRKVVAFIDDDAALSRSTVLGFPVFAAEEWLSSNVGAEVALGIGSNHARERAAARVQDHGLTLVRAIHPVAVIARTAKIAAGVVIMPTAVLNPECEIGEGAIINTAAVVEHDVVIGRYAHLSPNSAVGGGARIDAFAHIGMGANVLPGKRVGAGCVIGAGAV